MGRRVEITTRVRPEVHQALRTMAQDMGISLTQLLAGLMEAHVQGARTEVSQVA
jgi:predicted HicB family RNase H-like nuclease